jgi:hypothetical protein
MAWGRLEGLPCMSTSAVVRDAVRAHSPWRGVDAGLSHRDVLPYTVTQGTVECGAYRFPCPEGRPPGNHHLSGKKAWLQRAVFGRHCMTLSCRTDAFGILFTTYFAREAECLVTSFATPWPNGACGPVQEGSHACLKSPSYHFILRHERLIYQGIA